MRKKPRVRARISWHFGAPRPAGLRLPCTLVYYRLIVMIQSGMGAAAKCQVILARALSSKYLIAGLLAHLIAMGASPRLSAEPVALKASFKVRTERALMIPMRDGKRLSADVFRPDAEG